MARSKKGITAWIITWKWAGRHARVKEPFVLALDCRLSGKRVREIVELMYIAFKYAPSEKVAIAGPKGYNPYPARFVTLNGVPCEGQITCGHNPWLFARIVDDLKV